MAPELNGILMIGSLVASWIITNAMMRYAVHRDLIDHPNDRTSHSAPTPRGVGVAIVMATFIAFASIAWLGIMSWEAAIGLIGAGLVVALVGFVDDHGHVSPAIRFSLHLFAAVWAWYWLGHEMSFWFSAVVIIGLVWATNFYNFMDGIDGIAGIEAVTVCIGAVLMMSLAGVDDAWVLATASVGAASAGFLIWNFPPARIFMGDVGSGFLGITLGALALGSGVYWSWLILMGVFVVDATFTLFRRLGRREKLHHAHRSHAYQKAAVRFGHRTVTLAAAGINLFWLLPLALAVTMEHLSVPAGVVVAFTPLALLVAYFEAGK